MDVVVGVGSRIAELEVANIPADLQPRCINDVMAFVVPQVDFLATGERVVARTHQTGEAAA